jgi:hypothetical protein
VTASRRAASLACALAATAMALVWEAGKVVSRHRGDFSAIFHTGDRLHLPKTILLEQLVRFPGAGYDGQYYHLIAHDPLIRQGYAKYVDNPRMRWRRILVPGLANLLARGDDDYVDSCYLGVLFGAIFAGAWWLRRWSVAAGLSPWTGFGFLLVPATLTSLDRGTVDVALAALSLGFAAASGWALLLVLAAIPLARETGALLIGAHVAATRRWWHAAAALPFAGWWLYVADRTPPDSTPHLSWVPFGGIAYRLTHLTTYPITSDWIRKAAVLDYVAFLGICACFVLVVLSRRWWREREWLAAAAFCAALIFVGHPQVWAEAYAFGRVASPLLIMLGLLALRHRWWWGLAPLAMVLPRIVFQMR